MVSFTSNYVAIVQKMGTNSKKHTEIDKLLHFDGCIVD